MMKKVLVTIDVEGPAGKDPVVHLIYGETQNGRRYGIEYLMKLFDKYGIKGLFFVDIAEAWDYGKECIARVLKDIEAGGHDVGVHIHPDHMADPNRRFLWEYSYEEQKEIISKCTDFYIEVLGKKPLSFRAGRYGANDDTIEILDGLGYKYDMSFFYDNRRCRIGLFKNINRPDRFSNYKITEIPVTVYRSFSSPLYSRVDKVDCSMDYLEFKMIMNKILKNKSDSNVIVLFIHSFSALKWRKNPDCPTISKILANRIEKQIKWCINEESCEYISESILDDFDFSDSTNDKYIEEPLNTTNKVASYWFFAKRAVSIFKDRIILDI